jgi:acyl-CoA synthetase (AMP-forming)/AMP-acid ligase II
MTSQTLCQLLAGQAQQLGNRPALSGPNLPELTYAELEHEVAKLAKRLRNLGVQPNDRIAVVVENGPEMAVAFLAAAGAGVCAPLNPSYTRGEFEFFLRDLRARALLVGAETESPSVVVAEAMGLLLVRADPVRGSCSLSEHVDKPVVELPERRPEDCALVLHTSGSTAKPKLVPLTHQNLCASAASIVASLHLGNEDRCLNVMPLFHIHGLVGALLSSLAAGGTVVCAPGFNEERFFAWLQTCRPTWFTAVPTIHHTVVSAIETHSQSLKEAKLRFIRSCSSALPKPLMARLETAFGLPVVEAYGMTEASHQISINPLPPARRKPGSVGLPTGVEVAIVADDWSLLAPETEGEIVVRGASVTSGYEDAPDQNRQLFRDGWFRTGDQGYLDKEGYIFITGRIKEIINRGGEKIAPREVDEVLLEYPGVGQAVTFGVPHPTLGQDVAAAVVPRGSELLNEDELRSYAFKKLAESKVPSRIVCVKEIPKGATGKLRRLDLHAKLRDILTGAYVAPQTVDEKTLAQLWQKALKQEKVGIHDNFFLCGGDSLAAVQLAHEIGQIYGLTVAPSALFRAPTVNGFAATFLNKPETAKSQSLLRLSWSPNNRRLFCVPGTVGIAFSDLAPLTRDLASIADLFAFQDSTDNPDDLKALAAKYIAEMMDVDKEGPYWLLGLCSGAVIVFEMAQQLGKVGKTVSFLGMVEPTRICSGPLRATLDLLNVTVQRLRGHGQRHSQALLKLNSQARRSYLQIRWRYYVIHWAVRRYRPANYNGQIHLYLTDESLREGAAGRVSWRSCATQGAAVRPIKETRLVGATLHEDLARAA